MGTISGQVWEKVWVGGGETKIVYCLSPAFHRKTAKKSGEENKHYKENQREKHVIHISTGLLIINSLFKKIILLLKNGASLWIKRSLTK